MQPFLAGKNVVQQAYATSEVFQAKKQNHPVNSFYSRMMAIQPMAES